MLHIARVPQRNEEHKRTHADCNGSTAGKHPTETFNLGARVRIECDCDFVVEFLDLVEYQYSCVAQARERNDIPLFP